MEQSQFRMFSLGIVTATKPPGTDFILVTPMEELSLQGSGLISEGEDTFKGKKETVSGANFETKHTSKNYVRAKWLSIGNGNRTSAPDVVAGESVMLFKYSDVDEYFWDETGREPELRRLEDVLYSFSNLSGGVGSTQYDKDTSYTIRVSTRDKFIHIHTTDNDGEACQFDIKIDTRSGVMTRSDSLGNSEVWDAPAGTLTTVMNSEIIRKAPKITDISKEHNVFSNSILQQAKTVTNDASTVVNTGNVSTSGSDTAAGGNLNAKH